jgi:hypothetical protein
MLIRGDTYYTTYLFFIEWIWMYKMYKMCKSYL